MTRYCLAAGPMAYCLRQGLLPAPRAVPIGIRMLSTTPPAAAAGRGKKKMTKTLMKKIRKQRQPKTLSRTAQSKVKAKAKAKLAAVAAQSTLSPGALKARTPYRRRQKRGSGNWGPWGSRSKFTRRGPRTPGFKERKLDPERTTLRWAERRLMKRGTPPIGSRRRRVAIRTSPNLPFEHMPYQTFQEARKFLRYDRETKLRKLRKIETKMSALMERDPAELKGGEPSKLRRLKDTKEYVDRLLIQADANDPEVKRKFEDGFGDMDKPIYQEMARAKWEAYRKLILQQRINQFHIVPDVLPKLVITADVELRFRRERITPGSILPAAHTQLAPVLKVQLFKSGYRLVSIVVVDSDVPDESSDGFTSRCHFIATNVLLSPNNPTLNLRVISSSFSAKGNVPVPWLPPFSQIGSAYHRLGVYVLEQQRSGRFKRLDPIQISALYGGLGTGTEADPFSIEKRTGFSLKSFRDKFRLKPFAFNLFRTVWDESTRNVMEKYRITGADMQWKRLRDPRIKPLRKRRGWEAKRQGPKYRHLWKYTKRIRGWNDEKWRGDKTEKKHK